MYQIADSARPAIPPDEPYTPAQNAVLAHAPVAYLIWQVTSLAVSQDLVNCGLGQLSHQAELVLPSGANSRR
jgi:hypothetical protein